MVSDATMTGADADGLDRASTRFAAGGDEIRAHAQSLTGSMNADVWTGADAVACRQQWKSEWRPSLMTVAGYLDELAAALARHAAEQRTASSAGGATWAGLPGLGGPTGSGQAGSGQAGSADTDGRGGLGGLYDHVREAVGDDLAEGFDDLRAAVGPQASDLASALEDWFGGLGLSFGGGPAAPVPLDTPEDGRAVVVGAMNGIGTEGRIANDEIEVWSLDNGTYVVVLPGVTDLSAGMDEGVSAATEVGHWSNPLIPIVPGIPIAARLYDGYESATGHWDDNDANTARKMMYAEDAARGDDPADNVYARASKSALEAAGVPAGADVLLVGHSYGAYTAMDLAADPGFNAAHGADPDGYHVNVTHVVAGAAETGWRFDDLPPSTEALVVNNNQDLVHGVEDLLHWGEGPVNSNQVDHGFDGGLGSDVGHHPDRYADELASTDRTEIENFFDSVGEKYAAGGTRQTLKVPDPHLGAESASGSW